VSEKPSKNGQKSTAKVAATQFKPGNPGGPGRKEGSRNKATLLLDKLAENDGEEILRQTLEDAKGGDFNARKLVLDRIWPVRKGRAVALGLPNITTASDVLSALSVVADAVGAGEITPDEGTAVAAILEVKRKAIETVELEARVEALEKERHR
jgi:hypothetical protein